MVGGPPSHSAIKGRWGPGLAVRGSPRRQSPHRYPIPRPDLEKGRCQRREAPPTPATPPDAHAATENATASLPLHRPLLPARRWRPSTKPRPELRQLRHLIVCNLSTLSLCLSVIPNIYYYNAKYPDLMNIPKTKHDSGYTPGTRDLRCDRGIWGLHIAPTHHLNINHLWHDAY
jgi:hypothetical protein